MKRANGTYINKPDTYVKAVPPVRKEINPRLPGKEILYLHKTSGNQAVQELFRSGAVQAKLKTGAPDDDYEKKADSVADRVMRMPEPATDRRSALSEVNESIQMKGAPGQNLMEASPEVLPDNEVREGG